MCNKKYNIKMLFLFILVLLVVIISCFLIVNKYNKSKEINEVLKTAYYAYLPNEAKDYITQVYHKTGVILLTEKNKEENVPYLNPEYVEYLSYVESVKNNELTKEEIISAYDVIPNETIIDYATSNVNMHNDIDLPSSFDLRNVDGKNFVTPIKDQGGTGLCWSFATNAQAESYLLVKNNSSYKTGESNLFSEMQIDYATAGNGITDGLPLYDFSRILGDGGTFGYATTVMKDGLGLVDSEWRDFDTYDYNSMEKNQIYKYSNSMYDVLSTVDYPFLNLNTLDLSLDTDVELRNTYLNNLKKLIMENGGAYVATKDPISRCSIYVNGYRLLYNDGKCASGAHAMQIIGWDDDFEYSFCSGQIDSKNYYYLGNASDCNSGTIINGKGAWLIKNSWGTMQPYVYLAYDSMNSYFNMITSMDLKDWDNNYTLKASGTTKLVATYDKNTDVLEKLNKIKFTSRVQNLNYNVCVGNTSSASNLCKSISTTLPGIYTVDFFEENFVFSNDLYIKISSSSVGFSNGQINVYTNNADDEVEIRTEDSYYTNKLTSIDKYVLRLSSETINIPENSKIDYVILDQNRKEIISDYSYSENIVFANKVFSELQIANDLNIGEYILQTVYNDSVMCESKLIVENEIVTIEGEGTEENPYIINTPSQLNLIRLDRFAFYKLGQDIDLTYDTQNEEGLFYNDGKGWEPIRYSDCNRSSSHLLYCRYGFSGGFDGNNHKIIGLYINRPDEDGIGLFANTYNENYSNLYIKNVSLENPYIIGNDWVGALIGNVQGTTYERLLNISNIQIIDGYIKGNNYVGGLIGLLNAGSYLTVYGTSIDRHVISNLYNSASVSANNNAGGIFGMVTNIYGYGKDKSPVKVVNLLNNGEVSSNKNASGLIGYVIARDNNDISINNSINTGNLLGKSCSNNITCEFGDDSVGKLNLTNIYYLKDDTTNIFSDKVIFNNVLKKTLVDMKKTDNYLSWENFNDNWEIKTINDITRLPVLKFIDFDYTSVDDVIVDGQKIYNIKDYVKPNINAALNIEYKIEDLNIASITDEGIINGLKNGETIMNIISYYDGYEKDIIINVNNIDAKKTISFESNGGSKVTEITDEVGKNIIKPEDPSRSGYVFEGWYLDNETFNNKYEFDVMPEDNIVLYAKWSRIRKTISFESNGGSKVTEITDEVGKDIEKPEDPSRLGYVFEGWYLDNETFNNKYEFSVMPEDNIVLYAKWSRIRKTISFESNGGSKVTEITDEVGKNIIKPEDPSRPGYVFEGWYLDNEIFEDKYEFSVMPEDNIVLYAKWKKKIVELNKYKLNNNIISDVVYGTSLQNYLSNFKYENIFDIKFYDHNNLLQIDLNIVVGTGSKIKFYDNNELMYEYTNVVLADVTGDGLLKLDDIMKTANYIYRDKNSLKDVYLEAADYDMDGKYKLTDIMKMAKELYDK